MVRNTKCNESIRTLVRSTDPLILNGEAANPDNQPYSGSGKQVEVREHFYPNPVHPKEKFRCSYSYNWEGREYIFAFISEGPKGYNYSLSREFDYDEDLGEYRNQLDLHGLSSIMDDIEEIAKGFGTNNCDEAFLLGKSICSWFGYKFLNDLDVIPEVINRSTTTNLPTGVYKIHLIKVATAAYVGNLGDPSCLSNLPHHPVEKVGSLIKHKDVEVHLVKSNQTTSKKASKKGPDVDDKSAEIER